MLRVPNSHRVARVGPRRILHVVGEMNRGGIETWLMHVLRSMDRECFTMDFAVEESRRGAYDQEILELGSQIFHLGPRRATRYGKCLLRILRDQGNYDVIHAHVNHFNGYVMRLARQAGIPIRVSHSHTDTTAKERAASFGRRIGVGLLHRWIARHSTHGIAASVPAAISMFGDHWRDRRLCRVMHCGLDLEPFTIEYDRTGTRREFGIPEDAWVIGHVGRMVDVKNHRLMVETLARVLPQATNAYLLLVGEGPLRDKIETHAQELGVFDRVVFAGNRNDVPRILCSAFDVFVFPSKFEGLGLAYVEAQAAGLPCLISDVVPAEADIVPQLVTRLSIDEPWETALLRTRHHDRRPAESLSRVLGSDFSIQHGVAELQCIYEGPTQQSRVGRDEYAEAVK